MLIKLIRANSHRITIIISYILVFIIGFQLARDPTYLQIFQSSNVNRVTITPIMNKVSTKTPDEQSFYNIGMKYKTDKVTFHRYDIMYEKYLRKYVGSNFTLLEIGLGCDMRYGAGASANLWRTYLGPRANIHIIEFDKKCAESWQTAHGKQVNSSNRFT
jgi:hypothetical protein